ncbi:unnamed protein product [Lactuca virosa]|uniref:Rab-GAP TBC domain-containing protein n=1 Tax=Lactuca virosa TaxID=75947 RepID=A0AAU9MKW1_9ASTR|nr:unnamed protein product [Lactuca virosa]
MRRIESEENSLDASEIVITSTRQEIDEQWRLYDGFDPVLEKRLRARIRRNVSCYGRFMPRMVSSNTQQSDFDGHGGSEASSYVKDQVMKLFFHHNRPGHYDVCKGLELAIIFSQFLESVPIFNQPPYSFLVTLEEKMQTHPFMKLYTS